jgi:hypothetical protein
MLQQRSQRREKMQKDKVIETLARMWMLCDPNRCGSNPDEPMPMTFSSGGSDGQIEERQSEIGGQPRWMWFVPRAEASLAYLNKQGLELRLKP